MSNFRAKTERLEKLATIFPARITELKRLFSGPTNVYLDYANIYNWSEKLNWHVDPKRLKQFFDSFSSIKAIRLYSGTLRSDKNSLRFIEEVKELKYEVVTKDVKKMLLSIDVSGIPLNSPTILENFIKKTLLRRFTLETIEYLNNKLKELNNQGIKFIEHWKCNFDVEISRDMLLDCERKTADTFVLWSGDSDFADPVIQLVRSGKKVFLFATARRVSIELQRTGIPIFEIQKIRNFICRADEIQTEIRKKLA
jgi:uncharacterized LabA/DUF88 family protein